MSNAIIAAILGLGVAVTILLLVRRDRLHGPHSIWWLAVAGAAMVVGLWPALIDHVGRWLGVQYPPMLLALCVLAVLLVKLLALDLGITRRERTLRRMVQQVAILDAEVRALRQRLDASAPTAPDAAPPARTPGD